MEDLVICMEDLVILYTHFKHYVTIFYQMGIHLATGKHSFLSPEVIIFSG